MELFKIFGSILVDDKKALASLKKTDQEAYKVNRAFNTLGEAGAKIGKAVAVGAVAATTAMVALTTKTVSVLDDIDKASQRAGMGAEEFQRWGHVAGLSGIEMSKLESAAIKNQRAMAQASQGAGKAADSYKKLGIDIKGLTSDQVFEKVILNLSDMEDETERNAVANDIFGKSFADLAPLLNNSSDEIKGMKGELDALGAVMSEDQVKAGAELNDTMDRIKKMFGALALNIGNELIPHFQKIGDWILNHKDEIQESFEKVLNGISTAIEWVVENSDILIKVLGVLLGAFVAMKIVAFVSALIATLTTLIGAATTVFGFFNAVLYANPIGLVIAAIVALIAIGVLLYKNWDKVKEVASSLWGTVKSVFGNISNFISNTMNKAASVVSNAVNKIKGFFNFKWAFPKLKMPHFKVSGSMNPLNWIKQGVPKIGVEWYAKGGIMNSPTAFGMNGNNIMAGGEAGSEAILPLNESNLGAIGRGIAKTMGNNNLDTNSLVVALKQAFNGMSFRLEDGGDTLVAIVDNRLLEVI